ncbi:Glutaredoxin [Vaccinia virus Ankara]|uniref:Glutaredoxin-2 n=5 Tax=Vaccinia virus TaxID=10245 RepID=GLRX2_VACCA|nr:RecName: Full=Glutaredoxin-2 [Vaccinia virus Ankara]Q77TL3.1 RecName: Full=Glutaredoxin-2 [Vaccinia virus Tian Tan]AAB96442.1 glutaredoxin 2 [Vaccinia virus]QOS44601.1 MVA073L [synthetic construct]AAF33941.1 TG4R [Vaccinia virus Tian Tan]AAT10471.1 S-S bond formation pathway protein [Vaccinia virus]ABD52545.1 thiol-transferase [Vaccinia virus]
MKNVLIIFGKPYCSICENVSDAVEELKSEYDILHVDILSFFLKDGDSSMLGDVKRGTLIGNFAAHLSNYIVSIFKYNPQTKQMAFVDINKSLDFTKTDKSLVNLEILKSEIEKANYGVWPPVTE